MEIQKIVIREKGAVPRAMAKYHRMAAKEGYRSAGVLFHETMRAKRFTWEHGIAAGYRKRAGEELPWGSKAFWLSYFGRKLRSQHTKDPFVYSGTTRRRAQTVNMVIVRDAARLKYQLNVFNYISWARAEWTRMLPAELVQLGHTFETKYDEVYNHDLDEGMRFV